MVFFKKEVFFIILDCKFQIQCEIQIQYYTGKVKVKVKEVARQLFQFIQIYCHRFGSPM